MSTDIWLCLPCGKGGEEKGKTPFVDNKPCDYCGALCQNMHVPWGQSDPSPLPRGHFITADTAPPPRALSRQEREAQVREVPPGADGRWSASIIYDVADAALATEPEAEISASELAFRAVVEHPDLAIEAPPVFDPDPVKPPKRSKGKRS